MCKSVCSGIAIQYKQIPKKLHFWTDSLLNLTLKYWKSRKSTHYSRCLQELIQGEMLIKVWIMQCQYLSNYTTTPPLTQH